MGPLNMPDSIDQNTLLADGYKGETVVEARGVEPRTR